MNPPESVFNSSSRRNCLFCAAEGPVDPDTNCFRKYQCSAGSVHQYYFTCNIFHYLACPGDCLGVGQGACTGSDTCCPYYDETDGTCITNCTSNVINIWFYLWVSLNCDTWYYFIAITMHVQVPIRQEMHLKAFPQQLVTHQVSWEIIIEFIVYNGNKYFRWSAGWKTYDF